MASWEIPCQWNFMLGISSSFILDFPIAMFDYWMVIKSCCGSNMTRFFSTFYVSVCSTCTRHCHSDTFSVCTLYPMNAGQNSILSYYRGWWDCFVPESNEYIRLQPPFEVLLRLLYMFFFSMWMGDTHSKCKTHNRKPRQTTSVLRFAWFCMVQNILNLTFHGYQWLSCSHQHADMALAGARHGRGWLRCFLRPVPRIFEKHLPGLCQLISQPGVMGHKPNLREIVYCMYIYIYVNYIQ